MTIRVGQGVDVHRFDRDRPLVLGGVRLAERGGLAGHSDSDVILHAITDALLGAVAAGDIGSYFPSSDPEWRNASSTRFVERALAEVADRGGSVVAVDVTYVGNEPKISAVRATLTRAIASIMKLAGNQVSLKATTTDGLGLTGRGEGACAMAIVTVEMSEETV